MRALSPARTVLLGNDKVTGYTEKFKPLAHDSSCTGAHVAPRLNPSDFRPFWEEDRELQERPSRLSPPPSPPVVAVDSAELLSSYSTIKWKAPPESAQIDRDSAKRRRRKHGSGALADLYGRLGMHRLSERSRNCGRAYSRRICPSCGTFRPDSRGVFSCWSRFCPGCASRRGAAVAGRLSRGIEAFLQERPAYQYFLTLTFQNHEHLRDYSREYVARVRALFKHPWWKQYGLVGGIRAFEVKIGSGSGAWHPHFHVLVMTERPIPLIESGEFKGRWQNGVNQQVSDIWGSITEGSYIVQGEAVRGEHMRELLKYVCKAITELPDDRAGELIAWAKGKRFRSAFGKLYNSPTVRGAMAEEEENSLLSPCECGSRDFVIQHFKWNDGLSDYVMDDTFTVHINEFKIEVGESPPGESG